MSPSKFTKGFCMAKGQAMDSTRPVDQSWASQSTDLYEFKVFLPLTAFMMVCMYIAWSSHAGSVTLICIMWY